MPPRADAPLRRITLNLYESDCNFLSAYLGHGWTEQVRTLVHAYAQGLQPPRTLGNLSETQLFELHRDITK